MSQASLFDRPSRPEPAADKWGFLRWFQREACEAVFSGFDDSRSQMIVMATGLGKTSCFSAIAAKWPGRVLMLAHREELVQQAKDRLEAVTGEIVGIERAEDFASKRARIVCASVATLHRQSRLDRFGPDHFGLVIVDECFPAGTLVDGVPIERVAVGDEIQCVDHATGELKRRRVTARMEKLAQETWSLYSDGTAFECTGNHPVFVKRGESIGYVQASRVVPGDMLCLRAGVRATDSQVPEQAPKDVLECVSVQDLLSDDGGDQPPLRWRGIRTDEGEQPDGERRGEGAHDANASGQRAQAEDSRGEWPGRDARGTSDIGGFGLVDASHSADPDGARVRVPDALQAGRGKRVVEGSDRGGRGQPHGAGPSAAGPQERGLLTWSRVARVARNESPGGAGVRVYNLSVEGAHTYFANDALVHNCHHAIAGTYKKILAYFADAKVLGVTATPDRSDEKAMGRVFDAVPYVFDIINGIEQGYLVPLRGTQVALGEIQLDGVATVAGDLQKGQLDEVMVRAVEGICHKTLELEPNRQGIAFFPGVKSAQYACERWNALVPGSAGFVSGDTLPDERRAVLDAFRSGKLKYLCNCMVFTEGFDAPATSLIIQARPTKSRGLYAQMAGRGTRVLPGLVEGIPGREGAAERRGLIAASLKPDCVILDFVGNATKHALISPVDLLGGDYTDEEVEEAKKKARKENGASPAQLLEDARKELRAVAAAVRSKVTANVTTFNPFAVLNIDLESTTRDDMRWGRLPPSEAQINALQKMKVPPAAIKGMSQREATKMLKERNRRHDAGLSTYAQLAHLRKFGCDDNSITFAGANRALTYISQQGWSPSKVDTARVVQLAKGTP